MGARLPLCIVGGILMLSSLILPTLFYRHVGGEYFGVDIYGVFIYWMAGFFFTQVVTGGEWGIQTVSPYTDFVPDVLGIICIIIIIAGAILTVLLGSATEHKAAVVGGMLGIIGMLSFFIGVNMGSPLTNLYELHNDGYYFAPFIGFFVCIIGGILALVGGTLKKQ